MGAALARTVIGQARPAGVVPRYLVNTLVSFTDKAAGFRSLCATRTDTATRQRWIRFVRGSSEWS